MSALASSSKRPNTAFATQPKTVKRARPAPPQPPPKPLSVDEDEEDEEDAEVYATVDEAAAAKAARKEARTMRNRESAQRSRNQRKAHLTWLEVRVAELEAENQRLKAGEPAPGSMSTSNPDRISSASTSSATFATSPGADSSTSQTIMSLATDLGIPAEIVSGSVGVNLASIAPPPRDMVLMDPIATAIPLNPTAVPDTVTALVSALRAENTVLRERISLLENLVKQVVAVSDLGGYRTNPIRASVHDPSTTMALDQSPLSEIPLVDWDAILQPQSQPDPHLMGNDDLHPLVDANQSSYRFDFRSPLDYGADPSPSQPTCDQLANDTLARHPAAVATLSPALRSGGTALQRARTSSAVFDLGAERNRERISQVARVVVALARLRGWGISGLGSGTGLTLGPAGRKGSRRAWGAGKWSFLESRGRRQGRVKRSGMWE